MKVGSSTFQICGYVLAICMGSVLQPSTSLGMSSTQEEAYDSAVQRSKFFKTNFGRSTYSSQLFSEMDSKQNKLLWNLGMDGESLSSASNLQSQTASFSTGVKYRRLLMKGLSLRAAGKMQFQAGRTQDNFGDLEPNSGLYLREAVLRWAPAPKKIIIKTGVIGQRWLGNPLLIGGLAFPGMQQELRSSGRRWQLSLKTQQLIPTSSTLATRVQEKEKTPSFFTESLQATLQVLDNTWIRGRYTLFNFNHLPNVVAFRSQIYGNTYTGGDINNAEFISDFDGWMTQIRFEQKISDSFAVAFQGDWLRNEAGPDRFNESRRLALLPTLDLGRWIYQPFYETFFSEPDSTPGYYNDFLRGHNNRIGWGAGLSLESKEHNFRVKAVYFNARLLNRDTLLGTDFQQDDLKTISLTVETSYAGI